MAAAAVNATNTMIFRLSSDVQFLVEPIVVVSMRQKKSDTGFLFRLQQKGVSLRLTIDDEAADDSTEFILIST